MAENRSRSVVAGGEIVLDNFGFWNKDCQARSFTRKITQKPANGVITYRDAKYVVPERVGIGTSTGCVGQSVASKEVVYTPNAGFLGKDVVGLVVGNQSGSRAFLYTISVN
ncbi:MAG: hypothetical protein AAGA11_18425 [Pseudomonadota bacterium]